MNKTRIFNEVGDLYEASIINEGKSRFPGKDTFKLQTDKKVVPAVSKGTKAYVQQDSGPDHKGAETMIKPNDAKNRKNPSAEDERSVFNPERFSGQSPKKSVLTKKAKKREKIQKESINNFMTKSIFDKLYEAVINENDLPGDDNIEAHDAEALDLPVDGDGGDEVTITLDRETAKKLHDVLMAVIGEEAPAGEAAAHGSEATEDEDEEGLSFEATDIEEVKGSGVNYVAKGGKHGWELGGAKSNVVGDETDKLEDGVEGDGSVKIQNQPAPKKEKLTGPTPVKGKANVVPGRVSSNVGQTAFKK
jgi:hypothetical protein